jgi:ribosome biogenesis GTPase
VPGRGRHTTTSALALPHSGAEGWVVDTPGIRSFGLAHIDPSRVIQAFPDLEPGTVDCPRACSHDEPDCALDAWAREEHADPARPHSLRRLPATRERKKDD